MKGFDGWKNLERDWVFMVLGLTSLTLGNGYFWRTFND